MLPRFLRFTAQVQRRPHWRVALGVLLALLPWITAFSSEEGRRISAPEPAAKPAWQHHQGTALRFAYPPGWTLETATDPLGEESYVLVSPDAMLELRMRVQTLGEPVADLREVERLFVNALEQDAGYDRPYFRIRAARRIAGRVLATVEYGALRPDGRRVRGMRLGSPASGAHLLVFDVTARDAAQLRTSRHQYTPILETAMLVSGGPAMP